MRSSLPLGSNPSGSGIIPLQQHDQSIVDVEFGKAKDAPSSTFFLCPYFRLWATPSSMRLACDRPLSRLGSLPGTRNGVDLSSTRPNFVGGRSRPQTGTCLPSRRLRNPKQAPVYHCAGCVTPNRRLFIVAQASAEAEEVYSGTRPNFAAPAGALFTIA